MTSTERQDRAVHWIAIGSAFIAALTLLVAAVSLPILIDARGGVRATNRVAEVANCKSTLNADVAATRSAADDLILTGLVASALGDDEALRQIVARTPAVREARDDAVAAYRRGAELADSDVEAFLAECRAR